MYRTTLRAACAALAVVALAGCASFFSDHSSRSGVSSSVVDYLYPAGKDYEPPVEGIPEVRLPARVGLMFVPSARAPAGLTRADRQALLEQVRDAFKEQEFIDRIEIVPDNYLRPRGGFENLEQVARLHGFDLVALVSYDQVINTSESAASFLYWTIIGAYTVPATRNQATTFVEATVFDVASRTLLLRAPGQDQRDAGSTAIKSDAKREQLGRQGFEAAVADMIPNLETEIGEFSTRVREDRSVKLVDRGSGRQWRGSGGGGSVQAWELGLLLAAFALLLVRRRG